MRRRRVLWVLLLVVLFIVILKVNFSPTDEDIQQAVESTQGGLYTISLLMAFVGGILTLFAPCLIPFIPAYVATLRDKDWLVLDTAVFFTGFFIIFLILGFSVTYAGQFLIRNRELLILLSGAFIIVFGILILFGKGFGSPLKQKKKAKGIVGTFLFGMGFAIGWSPCIGPILFSILFMAANSPTYLHSALLLLVYVLGLSVPFLLLSFHIQKKGPLHWSWFSREHRVTLFGKNFIFYRMNILSASLLILLGLLYLVYGGTGIINVDAFELWTLNYVLQGKLLEMLSGVV